MQGTSHAASRGCRGSSSTTLWSPHVEGVEVEGGEEVRFNAHSFSKGTVFRLGARDSQDATRTATLTSANLHITLLQGRVSKKYK